ncbi:helix-turn-helix domain-containing protein [Streptomyces sp. NPDC056670]|uniref:helix-turn-helix domain-containing protein n=1 Tax=Streptomyces sp. NPDC056670 TaxID=3345904 RepID=UPI0036932F47
MKRPTLTQREAAAACGVSRSTIRRREAGELPGAFEDPNRGWLIPVEALLAAGFRLNAPTGPDPVPAEPAPAAEQPDADHAEDDDQDVAALRAELARVRADHDLTLARIEYERKVAAAQAETDRLRQELADRDALLAERAERIVELQRAVAALTPAPQRAAIEAADGRTVPNQATGEPNA